MSFFLLILKKVNFGDWDLALCIYDIKKIYIWDINLYMSYIFMKHEIIFISYLIKY